MTISLDLALKIGSAIVFTALFYAWVKHEVHALWKEVTILMNWRDKHNETSQQVRTIFEKDIANINQTLAVGNEQYKEILRRLDEMKEQISEIKNGGNNP